MDTFTYLNYLKFKSELQNHDSVLIDIRTPQEFKTGHINGAININYYSYSFQTDLNKLDKDKKYYIYCQSRGRSSDALRVFKKLGFINVWDLSGGIFSWKDELNK